MKSEDAFSRSYLSGERLYGDDLVGDDLAQWFADEAEAYASLGSSDSESEYGYGEFNRHYGFSHLADRRFPKALGFGSARGGEFVPLVGRIDVLTIVEASLALRVPRIGHLSPTYVDPKPDGGLPFDDNSFDLITCLGVLHHIPNVTAVLTELHRCLAPQGLMLLREPITSMGDWRYPRHPGLTTRERGLPLRWLRSTVCSIGLVERQESLCEFSLTSRLGQLVGRDAYDDRWLVRVDALASWATTWNAQRYHSTKSWHKVRPRSVFMILAK